MPKTTSAISPTIRLLTKGDGEKYRLLRLESLQLNRNAFLSTFENEMHLPADAFARHLEWAYHPPYFGYFGIFVDHELVGYLQVAKTFLDKQEHIAMINNLYLSPRFRGHGLAEQLFRFVFDLLEKGNQVERLFLTCSASNKPAQKLYKKLGFQRFGVKVRSIKWQDEYDDEVEMVKVLK